MMKEIFNTLNAINVNEHTEKKNDLTYLSWAWSWAELKKNYPDATYVIERFGENKAPYLYDDNLGYMVFTSMTINGLTHEMWLPVMDGANKAMKKEPYKYMIKNPSFKYAKKNKDDDKYYDKFGNVQEEYTIKTCNAATMFDINKTIMRCLVKNISMFGLGLYIYAGEDLPEEEAKEEAKEEIKEETTDDKEKALINEYQANFIKDVYKDNLPKLLKIRGLNTLEEMTHEDANKLIEELKQKRKAAVNE